MAAMLRPPAWWELFGPFLAPIEEAVAGELGPIRCHLCRVQVVDERLAVEIVTGDRDLELVEAIANRTITGMLPTELGTIPVDVTVYPSIGGRQ